MMMQMKVLMNYLIALTILCINEKGMCPAYISKISSNCEKKNFLMVPNEKKKNCIILRYKNYLHYYMDNFKT